MRARRRLGGKLLSQEVARNSTEPHSALDIAHRAFLVHRAFFVLAQNPPSPKSPNCHAPFGLLFASSFFLLPASFLSAPRRVSPAALPYSPIFRLPRATTRQRTHFLPPSRPVFPPANSAQIAQNSVFLQKSFIFVSRSLSVLTSNINSILKQQRYHIWIGEHSQNRQSRQCSAQSHSRAHTVR